MARSRRARRTLNSVEQLVDALPERFLLPTLGDNPLRSLATYVSELIEWLKDQGIKPESAQAVAAEVMLAVGASPADWYLRAAIKRGT